MIILMLPLLGEKFNDFVAKSLFKCPKIEGVSNGSDMTEWSPLPYIKFVLPFGFNGH